MNNSMNSKVRTALGVATTGLVLSMLVSSAPVQAAAAKAQSVFVNNTDAEPVPTKAIGTSAVSVENLPAVQAVRDTAQQFTTQVAMPADGSESEVCSTDPIVPEGKRMIVDTVIAEVRGGSTAPNLFLYGIGARPYLELTKVQDATDAPGSWVSGSSTYWGATEQLHLILGPTTQASVGAIGEANLTAEVCIHPKNETRYVVVQFNGVLEDL